MRRVVLLLLLLLLASCGLASAEDFICGRVILGRTLYGLVRSVDPTAVQVQGCLVVPKADTAAQRIIEETVIPKYRKLVANLLEEMTAAEKTAADVLTAEEAAQAAADAAAAAILAELVCHPTIAELDSIIGAIATLDDAKVFLNKFAKCMLLLQGRLTP